MQKTCFLYCINVYISKCCFIIEFLNATSNRWLKGVWWYKCCVFSGCHQGSANFSHYCSQDDKSDLCKYDPSDRPRKSFAANVRHALRFLHAQLTETKVEQDKVEPRLAALETRLDAMATEAEAREKERRRHEKMLERTRQDNRSLRRKMRALEKTVDTLKAFIQGLAKIEIN